MSRARSGAVRVASGIFLSRLVGFLRDRAIAHYFGVGPHADVFRTALRGPNILQNLLGEGTISASFIPIYSRLIEEGREEEAGRFAGAIFGLLLVAAGVLAGLGILLAGPIVTVLAAGFLGDAAEIAAGEATVDRFALTVMAVKVIFPMTGLLVLAAWALGVLNSHRRFFVPYVAPVLWNAAIIAGVVWVGAGSSSPTTATLDRLLMAACWGALVGGALQLGVQLPFVASVIKGFRPSFSTRVGGVREALKAFGPVVAGRGVVQISAYLDVFLASLVAPGAVAALGWAQTLYILPISLFGMSVAAAELPELSRASGQAEDAAILGRVDSALRHMAFVTVPTALGYVGFGFLLVGALYRTGSFTVADNWLVYLVLAAYSLGLVAASSSRLLQSAFYAFGDTATPSKIAVQRVILSAATGAPLMFLLDRVGLGRIVGLGESSEILRLGALGLALAAALASWFELARLWRCLRRRLPDLNAPTRSAALMLTLAGASGALAGAVWWMLPPLHVALTALVVLSCFAIAYLASTHLLGMPEADAWVGRALRMLR